MKIITLLIFVLLITVLPASCISAVKNEPFIHREWLLISYNGISRHDITSKPARVDLSQKSDGKTQHGNGEIGCSQLNFNYHFRADGNIRFRLVSHTKTECSNNSQEDKLIKSLSESRKFTLAGHYLLLTDGSGHQIKFIAADWD
jgi:heat shock protein HslJ